MTKLSGLATSSSPASTDKFVMVGSGPGDVLVSLANIAANMPALGSASLAPVHASAAVSPGSSATWGDIGVSSTFTVPTNGTVGLIWANYGGQWGSAPPSVTTGLRMLLDGTTQIFETRLDVGAQNVPVTHSFVGAYTFTAGSHTAKLQTSTNAGSLVNYYGNFLILFLNA